MSRGGLGGLDSNQVVNSVSFLLEFAQGSAEFTAVEFQSFLRW